MSLAHPSPAARRGHTYGEAGYLLVSTIWILAAITIAAAYFAGRVEQSVRLASQRLDRNDALMALQDARQELFFRVATNRGTGYGLGMPPAVIRLDDRPYKEGGTVIRVQDVAGLMGINMLSERRWRRLFSLWEVPDERQSVLIDSLLDYIDDDSLQHLNGAEAPKYAEAGRKGLPRNAPLATPAELRQVWGWAETPQLWKPGRVLDLASSDDAGVLNLNTASEVVLQSVPSIGPAAARAIVERREIEPVSAAWLDRMLGTEYDTMSSPVAGAPIGSFRITQEVSGVAWALRYNLTLTPKGADRPWKVTSQYLIERTTDLPGNPASSKSSFAHVPDVPSLPPRIALAASAPLLFSE